MKKYVAIIGAGASGLPAIKSCLEEGLEPVCYEMTGFVGGLWNYVEEDCPERATVFRGVVMNTSKEMSSFSDFPAPIDFGTFLPHHEYAEYCLMYAKHFKLLSKIHFLHKVISIHQEPVEPRKWVVEVQNMTNDVIRKTHFDSVMICTGHHCVPNWPSFAGQEEFNGVQIHSQQYRKPEIFENKRVLVVGFGNSACDIASECAGVAKEVLLSSRNTSWLFPRQVLRGAPWDSHLYTRINTLMCQFKSWLAISAIYEKIANDRFDHEFYGVSPQRRFINHYPIANDYISMHILSGKVRLIGGIVSLSEDSVVFEGDAESRKIDVIIYATGFDVQCPFIAPVLNLKDEIRSMYKMVFPIKLGSNPSLAFIGLTDTNGASNAVVNEMQARYAAKVFSGKCTLPSEASMAKWSEDNSQKISSFLGKNHRLPSYIDALSYTDELAGDVGCRPRLFRLFFKDPSLFWACLTGPLLSYQYRIDGPHSSEGAREAILGFKQRFGYHMRSKSEPRESSSRGMIMNTIRFISVFTIVTYCMSLSMSCF